MSDVQQSLLFAKAKAKAADYLSDPVKLRGLARKATAKATSLGQDGPVTKIWDDLTATLRLVGHLCAGTYTCFPARSLLLLVAGLLYFVWPLDLAPDALPIIGWFDDVTLLAFVIRSIRIDLDAFQKWEKTESENDAEEIVCLD